MADQDAFQWLRDDFRRQLEVFYAGLKLAPPYHSVEKAIMSLSERLKEMGMDERARAAADPTTRWMEYRKAFVQAGLHRKHRGIIAGLVRSKQTTDLPSEHEHFLNAYLK